MSSLDERVARVEEQVRDMRNGIDGIVMSISGPPRGESLRGRLHQVENNQAAAKAATAALEAARAMRTETFSRREKIGAVVFAVISTACTIITTTLVVVAQT